MIVLQFSFFWSFITCVRLSWCTDSHFVYALATVAGSSVIYLAANLPINITGWFPDYNPWKRSFRSDLCRLLHRFVLVRHRHCPIIQFLIQRPFFSSTYRLLTFHDNTLAYTVGLLSAKTKRQQNERSGTAFGNICITFHYHPDTH